MSSVIPWLWHRFALYVRKLMKKRERLAPEGGDGEQASETPSATEEKIRDEDRFVAAPSVSEEKSGDEELGSAETTTTVEVTEKTEHVTKRKTERVTKRISRRSST